MVFSIPTKQSLTVLHIVKIILRAEPSKQSIDVGKEVKSKTKMKLTVGLKKQGNSYKILSDPNTALSPTLYVRSYVYSQLAKAELIYLAHKHKQLNE